jgi:predicted PurR-regulated permease PerM
MAKTVRERNATTSDQVTTVLSYGALCCSYLAGEITAPFLVPLAWSAVLAIFFYPLHEKVGKNSSPI